MIDPLDPVEAYKVTALTTSTTRRVVTAQLAGVGSEGDDAAAERFDDAEVVQPCGLMARPALTATTEAIGVRRGDELIALFLIDKGAAVQDVDAGETRLHGAGSSNATTVIRLRADGSIDITSAANGAININAHGVGDVVVNGGTLKVARVTDATTGHTHAFALTAGPYPVAGTITTATDTIASSGGAARFKG